MKINEVEAAVGVTKKNIRFYEEEGLISPSREPGNGYRSYSQADVERLRRIKLLRKLDVPLAEIREMLEGQRTLAEGMSQDVYKRQASCCPTAPATPPSRWRSSKTSSTSLS